MSRHNPDPEQTTSFAAVTPTSKRRRKWPWIVLGVLILLVVIGVANAPTSAPSPAAAPTTAPATSAVPSGGDRELCRQIGDSGGAFYLQVTSAAAHNFSECKGGTVVPDDLDALLNLPGMDRRCLTGNDDVAQEQAIIGVYADTKKADAAAARLFCSAKGWTND